MKAVQAASASSLESRLRNSTKTASSARAVATRAACPRCALKSAAVVITTTPRTVRLIFGVVVTGTGAWHNKCYRSHKSAGQTRERRL